MSVEKHTKEMYDQFGKEYQKTRDAKKPERAYNEFMEVPAMFKAVGNVKGKMLLDIGCGAGIHIQKYLEKGAICKGIDLSKSMIELAKKNCPSVEFKTGSMTKLPYANSLFDVVTASLCLDYVRDFNSVFKEVNRVLKKGGLFFYSNESHIATARERYEDENYKIVGLGYFIDKKTGKRIELGKAWDEGLAEWEMVPGMLMKTYHKTFRTQLKTLIKNGFELIDLIDCKPVPEFKKYAPDAYDIFMKYPLFSIYVARKK